MIKECPNCLERVIPNQNYRCPSCGKSMILENNGMNKQSIVYINDSQKLPNICFSCGNKSDLLILFGVNNQNNTESDPAIPLKMYSTFGYLIYLIYKRFSSDYDFKIKIPICKHCRYQIKRIEPQHIDFDNRKVKLIAHKTFKEQLEKAN